MKMNFRFFAFSTLVLAALAFSGNSFAAAGPVGKKVTALPDEVWKTSEWISVVDAPVVTGRMKDGCRAADGANWFVCTVKNDAKVVSAKWMTAGLGVYELYVNGKLIGEEILKPGFTHAYKTKRSFTYDVTDAIKKSKGGVNTFAAQVTPGWWADKIVTPAKHEGMVGKKCAFRGVLELVYSDGTRKLYGTDTENWKAGIAGKVKHAAIFDGEVFDAREPMGYECAAMFKAPEINNEFKGEILPSEGAEIYLREDIALAPVKAYTWKGVEGESEKEYGKVKIVKEFEAGKEMVVNPGETLVVDFGQNCAGVPSFVFKAAAGTKLRCVTSELLNDGNGAKKRGMDGPEGSVHRLNLRIPNQGMYMDYTFAGKGYETYRPSCTFFGYRLISLTADQPVRIKAVKSVPVSSIAQNLETGKISTGHESVNRLISNTYWGMLSNYLSVPTDCPQRNERLGWTADTQVFAETGTFFGNTMTFFHKWMRDMCDQQHRLGGFPGVAPFGQYGNETMRLGWSDAGIICPWTIWKQYDDKAIVDQCWPAIDRYMQHVYDTKYDHVANIPENGNYQWADWLSYEALESCGGGSSVKGKPRPEAVFYWNFLSACYWAIDAEMMRDMAAATGRDADRYQKMADEAVAYIREKFLNADGTFKVDVLNTMQTPALFALKVKAVDGKAKEDMIARLRENFKQHDNCLQTGFLGTSILMATLTENGMSDIAYELLFQRKNPSWLYSVDNGATTIWERWNSYMLDTGMGPRGMNSFNHYAYGCVCEWIWETAAGIAADPAQPGFKHIIMKPVPDKRLGHLDAVYKSAAGEIRSSWAYEGEKWVWNFTIPEGASATVTLPGETESREYAAGSYSISR